MGEDVFDTFDEFGNYIGDNGIEPDFEDVAIAESMNSGSVTNPVNNEMETSKELIIKPTLSSFFNNDIEILVETEDQQDSNIPLVEPQDNKQLNKSIFTKSKKNIPESLFNREYMVQLSIVPERNIRVSVLGPLHSGKTSLVDLLVLQSHKKVSATSKHITKGWKPLKYTDNLKLEVERGVSMKLNGITFMDHGFDEKNYIFTIIDTPGHVNFIDEVAVGLKASNSCIIVIDAVEGVTSVVEKFIKLAQISNLPIVFLINKLDRLILELKLSPKDTFLKLKTIVNKINVFTKKTYSPELGNILFGSSKLGFTFSIKEFVKYYYSSKLKKSDTKAFIDRLWGNIYCNEGTFSKAPNKRNETTFVQFILNPIYKLFTHSLSRSPKSVAEVLQKEFHVTLEKKYFGMDPQPLLRYILKLVFRQEIGLLDALLDDIQTGTDDFNGSKTAHVLKLMDYCGELWSLVYIHAGSFKVGDNVKILNDTQSPESIDEDEIPSVIIQSIGLMGGRYVLSISEASSGQLVLMKGLERFYTKSATLSDTCAWFPPINYINEPVFKVAIQPHNPSKLSKLLEGLEMVNKLYPGVTIKVEESGEYIILGSGELYLDSLLYDLRINYSQIEIKISTPMTRFSESCIGESFASIPISSPNGAIKLSIIAKPLEPALIQDFVKGKLQQKDISDQKLLSKKLRVDYGWDSLAARNIWSFNNCNIFVDDTLPDEVDKEKLLSLKSLVIQGFNWCCKEGPLAEEPIYGVNFQLIDFQIDELNMSSQIIPMIRKGCYVALMTATPILMEPIFECNIIVHEILISVVEDIFKRRRGSKIYRQENISGTPLVELKGQIPVIESIGFETDLRLSTNGGGMCQLHFWNKIWKKVPGDVMDANAFIPKLKPAPIDSLSRDFVMKTRRRKGLSCENSELNDGPTLKKYIDDDLYRKLREKNIV